MLPKRWCVVVAVFVVSVMALSCPHCLRTFSRTCELGNHRRSCLFGTRADAVARHGPGMAEAGDLPVQQDSEQQQQQQQQQQQPEQLQLQQQDDMEQEQFSPNRALAAFSVCANRGQGLSRADQTRLLEVLQRYRVHSQNGTSREVGLLGHLTSQCVCLCVLLHMHVIKHPSSLATGS